MNHDNLESPSCDGPDICNECEWEDCRCPLCPGCGETVEQSACKGCDVCPECAPIPGWHHESCAVYGRRGGDCRICGEYLRHVDKTAVCLECVEDREHRKPERLTVLRERVRAEWLTARSCANFKLYHHRRTGGRESLRLANEHMATGNRALRWLLVLDAAVLDSQRRAC